MTAFTTEDNYVTRARADCFFSCGPGSLLQLPDGRAVTVVYNNLDGYGVVFGDRFELIGAEDDGLPEPEAMLRDTYPSCKYQCVGELVRILRRVKPDGSVLYYMTPEDAGVTA